MIKLILTKGDAVAHVTSLTRGPTQAMRYALLWTSPVCAAQGCTRTVLEHDHTYGAEYTRTRHTRLDEIDRLCHSHHALHTHRGWALIPGTGKRPMVPPTDPRHPANAGTGPGATGTDPRHPSTGPSSSTGPGTPGTGPSPGTGRGATGTCATRAGPRTDGGVNTVGAGGGAGPAPTGNGGSRASPTLPGFPSGP